MTQEELKRALNNLKMGIGGGNTTQVCIEALEYALSRHSHAITEAEWDNIENAYLAILSLEMANLKMNTQLLGCLLDPNSFDEWLEAFNGIEKRYNAIKEYCEEKPNE